MRYYVAGIGKFSAHVTAMKLRKCEDPSDAYLKVLQEASFEVMEYFRGLMTAPCISFSEALDGVTLTSSAGFPYAGNKGMVLRDKEALSLLMKRTYSFWTSNPVRTVFKICPKYEILPSEKKTYKERIFVVAPFDHHMAMTMLLEKQLDNCHKNYPILPWKTGTSRFYGDLAKVMKQAISKGYWVEEDFDSMEYRQYEAMSKALCWIRENWMLNPTPDDRRALRELYSQACHKPVWCVCGALYWVHTNKPSGMKTTLDDNGLEAFLKYYCVWKEAVGTGLEHFLQHNAFAIIGDNVLRSYTSEYAHVMNHDNVRREIAKNGYYLKLENERLTGTRPSFCSMELDGYKVVAKDPYKMVARLYHIPASLQVTMEMARGIYNEVLYTPLEKVMSDFIIYLNEVGGKQLPFTEDQKVLFYEGSLPGKVLDTPLKTKAITASVLLSELSAIDLQL